MKRALALSVILLLLAAAGAHAGEKLYLSRTLDLKFRHPGLISKTAGAGAKPMTEELGANTYVLVMPPEIRMALSITNDNPDEHHYHICVVLSDEKTNSGTVRKAITPDKPITDLWLGPYRYHFMLVTKQATAQNNFVQAVLRIDVYGPGDK